MNDQAVGTASHLRTAGKRVTPQRKLVLDILAASEDHLNAYDIYERARRHDAQLSLSTVYRTLGMLKEIDAVRELHLDDEQHHYELADKEEHSHLICLGCGQIIEVDGAVFEEAASAAGATHDFVIVSAQIELSGYCSECRGEGLIRE
jgi:Fur family ferric uptake transcriptional regulator